MAASRQVKSQSRFRLRLEQVRSRRSKCAGWRSTADYKNRWSPWIRPKPLSQTTRTRPHRSSPGTRRPPRSGRAFARCSTYAFPAPAATQIVGDRAADICPRTCGTNSGVGCDRAPPPPGDSRWWPKARSHRGRREPPGRSPPAGRRRASGGIRPAASATRAASWTGCLKVRTWRPPRPCRPLGRGTAAGVPHPASASAPVRQDQRHEIRIPEHRPARSWNRLGVYREDLARTPAAPEPPEDFFPWPRFRGACRRSRTGCRPPPKPMPRVLPWQAPPGHGMVGARHTSGRTRPMTDHAAPAPDSLPPELLAPARPVRTRPPVCNAGFEEDPAWPARPRLHHPAAGVPIPVAGADRRLRPAPANRPRPASTARRRGDLSAGDGWALVPASSPRAGRCRRWWCSQDTDETPRLRRLYCFYLGGEVNTAVHQD